MKKAKGVLSILCILIFSSFLMADIINVPVDQQTIQAGIDVANNSDTVLVDTGRYYENINFNGRNIVVGSLFITSQDTNYISQTTIDGNQNGSVVIFENQEDSTTVLSGFTITNGNSNWGGGIHIKNYACPHLTNLIIKENTANSHGGGIYIESSDPSITKILISMNIATFKGGGIYSYHSANPSFTNVTICENTADIGGAFYVHYFSNPYVVNSILWYNTPQEIYLSTTGDFTVTYSDIQGSWDGTGNIDLDPLFVNPNIGDFHLTENSPCIDAGDPNSPLDPDSTIADMGAFYYEQVTAIDSYYNNNITDIVRLFQNYQNPFNPVTTISYQLPKSAFVNLSIYNITGQLVETIVNDYKNPGFYTVEWNASNVGSGIYFYKISAGEFTKVRKCLVVK